MPAIRYYSRQFKNAIEAGDEEKQKIASENAWDAMTRLFEILRGEQDDGNLAPTLMNADTALIADGVSSAEQDHMLAMKKIDRARSTPLSLRNSLNKIAHYKTATFRVDKRGAHYLLLAGAYRNQYWVAEILVSKLCKNAATAIRAITN